MKTTVNIPDSLLKQAKRIALNNNSSLKQLIIEALRQRIEEEGSCKGQEIEIVTYKGTGLQSGLSWDRWSEIQEMVYDGRGGQS